MRDRITETGVATDDTRAGVVLAAVGSSDSRANDRTRALAGVLADGNLWATAACFATSAEPTVGQAISQLRSRGVERIVIAPWFLAPGRLTDRLGAAALDAAPDVVFAETIGAHRNVAEVALDRYRTALGAADSWRLSA